MVEHTCCRHNSHSFDPGVSMAALVREEGRTQTCLLSSEAGNRNRSVRLACADPSRGLRMELASVLVRESSVDEPGSCTHGL